MFFYICEFQFMLAQVNKKSINVASNILKLYSLFVALLLKISFLILLYTQFNVYAF